jgi:hypothetical protein
MGAYVAVALPVLLEGGSLSACLITAIHSGPIGFVSVATAPKCRAVSTTVGVACPVIAMTRKSGAMRRILRMTSRPLSSGIMMSTRARSRPLPYAEMMILAWLPVSASSTSNSAAVSCASDS